MAPNVTFVLNADEAQAVAAFLKVQDSQKQVTRAARDAGAAFDRQSRQVRDASAAYDAIGQRLRGVVGTLVGGYSVQWALRQTVQSFEESIRLTKDFEREMTGLLSLGSNARNFASVKQEVLDLSAAMGVARSEVANMMFNLQSGASGLDVDTVRQLRQETFELSKATGTDLAEAMTVLLKTYRIYGDEVSSVQDLQTKLFQTAERGYMTFSDLATLLPNVANAAKGFGYELDEVLGMLTVATQVGGDNEQTFTGVRNIFLRMNEALDQGIPLTNDLITNLEILSQQDPDVVNKIFGDRTFATVQSLADNTARVREEIEKIATASGDPALERLWEKMGDAAYRMSQITASFDQAIANAGIFSSEDAAVREKPLTDFKAQQLGAMRRMPQEASWLRKPWAWSESAVRMFQKLKLGWEWGQATAGGLWSGSPLLPNEETRRAQAAAIEDPGKWYNTARTEGRGAILRSMRAAWEKAKKENPNVARDHNAMMADYYETLWNRGPEAAERVRLWNRAGIEMQEKVGSVLNKGWRGVAGALGLPESWGGRKSIEPKEKPESEQERQRKEEKVERARRAAEEASIREARMVRDYNEWLEDTYREQERDLDQLREDKASAIRRAREAGRDVRRTVRPWEYDERADEIREDVQRRIERRYRDTMERRGDLRRSFHERYGEDLDSVPASGAGGGGIPELPAGGNNAGRATSFGASQRAMQRADDAYRHSRREKDDTEELADRMGWSYNDTRMFLKAEGKTAGQAIRELDGGSGGEGAAVGGGSGRLPVAAPADSPARRLRRNEDLIRRAGAVGFDRATAAGALKEAGAEAVEREVQKMELHIHGDVNVKADDAEDFGKSMAREANKRMQ